MAPLLAYLPGPENRRRPLIGRRPHIRTGRPCRRPAAMPQIEIRDALPADAEAIRAIYNDAVLHTRSEEHTSELQSLMRISYAVFCLKKKKNNHTNTKSTVTI